MAERVVVVTGASAGVGRALVRELAAAGDRVALLARDSERLAAAAREVGHAGGRALAIVTDVADPEQVERAASEIERALGPIDVWINNAMVTVLSPVHELSPDEIDRVTRVTYLGAAFGTLSALRRMRPRGRGHIVQVGSALAYRAIPLQSAYCAAKHALRAFTDSLRAELLHDGIDIGLTMVQLPALNTPQFDWCRTRLPKHPQPVPPIFDPEVAARAIALCLGKRRRELFVGSSTVRAVYASRFINGLLDRYLAKVGYEGQQANQDIDPTRPDNLFAPVAGHWAAHGSFDHRSKHSSIQLWAALHRGSVTSIGIALLIAGSAALVWML